MDKHGLTYEISWQIGAEPFLTRQGNLIKAAVQAIFDVSQQNTVLSTGGGTSDGRFIAPTGAEVVELGTSHATAHHVDECVHTDDLLALRQIYEKILNYIFQ